MITNCLMVLAVTGPMLIDGDSIAGQPSIRLTGEGNVPFDTPETYRPGCAFERELGEDATQAVRDMMPGAVCVIEFGGGGFGRHLGVLYGRDGRDVREALMEAGLAKASQNANWCADD